MEKVWKWVSSSWWKFLISVLIIVFIIFAITLTVKVAGQKTGAVTQPAPVTTTATAPPVTATVTLTPIPTPTTIVAPAPTTVTVTSAPTTTPTITTPAVTATTISYFLVNGYKAVSVTYGSQIILSWQVNNAISVQTSWSQGLKPLTGSESLTVTESKDFILFVQTDIVSALLATVRVDVTTPGTTTTYPAYPGSISLNPAPVSIGTLGAESATYSLQYLAPNASSRGSNHDISFFLRGDIDRALLQLKSWNQVFSNQNQFCSFILNAFSQSQFINSPVGRAMYIGTTEEFPVVLMKEDSGLVLYRIEMSYSLTRIASGPIVSTRFNGQDPGNWGQNNGLLELMFSFSNN
jgi:hypothetical protein